MNNWLSAIQLTCFWPINAKLYRNPRNILHTKFCACRLIVYKLYVRQTSWDIFFTKIHAGLSLVIEKTPPQEVE